MGYPKKNMIYLSKTMAGKEEQRNKEQTGKIETNTKMVGLSANMSITIINVNLLNNSKAIIYKLDLKSIDCLQDAF